MERYRPLDELPASAPEAAPRLRAKLIGDQAAGEVRAMLDSLEIRVGSWIYAPMDARKRAESEELRRMNLMSQE